MERLVTYMTTRRQLTVEDSSLLYGNTEGNISVVVTLIMLKPVLPAWGTQEESEFKKK